MSFETYDYEKLRQRWGDGFLSFRSGARSPSLPDYPYRLDRDKVMALSEDEKCDLIQFLFHESEEKSNSLENAWDTIKDNRHMAEIACEAYQRAHRRLVDMSFGFDVLDEIDCKDDEISGYKGRQTELYDENMKLKQELDELRKSNQFLTDKCKRQHHRMQEYDVLKFIRDEGIGGEKDA